MTAPSLAPPLPPSRKIKAIFFDLDDTLVQTKDIDVQAYERVVELAHQLVPGLDGQQLIADWRALFREVPWDPEHKTEVEEWRAGLWQRALASQLPGLAGSSSLVSAGRQLQACFSSTRLSLFQFAPQVEELLASLAAAGYALVLITNGHHLVQRQKVASCAAGRHFPHILVGGEEVLAGRGEKPHPVIFDRACELAGCQPSEAVHIGDSLKCDVQGGINAGLAATIWINPDGKEPVGSAPRPHFQVASVLEVLQVLGVLESGGGCGGAACGAGGCRAHGSGSCGSKSLDTGAAAVATACCGEPCSGGGGSGSSAAT